MKNFTRPQVVSLVRNRYAGPGLPRFITRLRPYICPFEAILSRMPPSLNMYDAGCGTGILSALATGFGLTENCLGTDTSAAAVRLASLANHGYPNTRFERLLPGAFPPGPFDLITCVDVVHHVSLSSQRHFVQHLARLLEPNGTLMLKDISPHPAWKAATNILHDLVMARQLVNLLPEQTLAAWLKEAGLQILSVQRLDRLWYSHFLIVAKKGPAGLPGRP